MKAQDYTLSPDVFEFNSENNVNGSQQIAYVLKNNTSETLMFSWTLEIDESFPKEWEFYICDFLVCGWVDQLQLPPEPGFNHLLSGDTTSFNTGNILKVFFNDMEGVGIIRLCIYDTFDYTQEPLVCSQLTTATQDPSTKEIFLYPNPALNYFQVTKNDDIHHLEIYSIHGNRFSQEIYRPDSFYDISHLSSGMYIVLIKAKNNRLLKVLKLYKQ